MFSPFSPQRKNRTNTCGQSVQNSLSDVCQFDWSKALLLQKQACTSRLFSSRRQSPSKFPPREQFSTRNWQQHLAHGWYCRNCSTGSAANLIQQIPSPRHLKQVGLTQKQPISSKARRHRRKSPSTWGLVILIHITAAPLTRLPSSKTPISKTPVQTSAPQTDQMKAWTMNWFTHDKHECSPVNEQLHRYPLHRCHQGLCY